MKTNCITEKNCLERNCVNELIEILTLERTGDLIFTGQPQDIGFLSIYGGHILAQALSAATLSVEKDFSVHSLHTYFIFPGEKSTPLVYHVERLRDGKSFATRQVEAFQLGRRIASITVSFQKPETGFEHQEPMPEVPPPEEAESEAEMAYRLADRIDQESFDFLTADRPFELRTINPMDISRPTATPPEKHVWFKTTATVGDERPLHEKLLAYASDFYLINTSLQPHARTYWSDDVQMASLDHALWFHREFRVDDWLLYVMKSTNASGGRGLIHGAIYTMDGTLAASSIQEGLIRPVPLQSD